MNDSITQNSELLARLDERTKAMQSTIANTNQALINEIAGLRSDINSQNSRFDTKLAEEKNIIINEIEKLKREITENYVKNEKFDPIQKLVYGTVGLILLSVGGALLAMVLK